MHKKLDMSDANEPDEGDYTTSDHSHFYQYGRLVLTVDRDASTQKMWRALEDHMKKAQFWPNVWFISDHGNAHLMSKPKRRRGQSRSKVAVHARAVSAALKKYGERGGWISGGLQAHWPESVKNKIRKLAHSR